MWKMRWKTVSLNAAMITVISAQFLAIDNTVLIHTPPPETENVPINPVESNETHFQNLLVESSTSTTDVHTMNVVSPTTDDRMYSNYEGTNPKSNTFTSTAKSESNTETTSDNIESVATGNYQTTEQTKGKENETASSIEIVSDLPPNEVKINETKNNYPAFVTQNSRESNESLKGGDMLSGNDVVINRSIESVGSIREGTDSLVYTSHGRVKGHAWHGDTEIIGFIDIPYGKINGPFEAASSAQTWINIHDVSAHAKKCPQMQGNTYVGDANCLTLSIFKPKDVENASVLFYVHDGALSASGDPLVYGPEYLIPKGIILVLPNYRLGPHGFLCLQNETAPGNAGLKDLSLALEWVYENIKYFGGEPGNIVVSGSGDASAYVGYLALCSSSHHINKVITESGSALSHWALDREPLTTAIKLADKIRFKESDGLIYNNTFAEASLQTIVKEAVGIRFKPCLEHDREPFLDDTPWNMLHDNKIDITFMIGSASYAGTLEAMDLISDAETVEQLNDNFEQILPNDLVFNNEEERKELAQKLKTLYFDDQDISSNCTKNLALWYTDASYLCPGIRLARPLVAAGATVYVYEFDFVGSLNRELEDKSTDSSDMPVEAVLRDRTEVEGKARPVPGAVRGDIVGYLFKEYGTTPPEAESPEKRTINQMVDFWVSFIDTGKPTTGNVIWNKLKNTNDSEEQYLHISSKLELRKGIHLERLRTWTDVYNQHFIERSSEPSSACYHNPFHYFVFMVSLMFLMANTKLN